MNAAQCNDRRRIPIFSFEIESFHRIYDDRSHRSSSFAYLLIYEVLDLPLLGKSTCPIQPVMVANTAPSGTNVDLGCTIEDSGTSETIIQKLTINEIPGGDRSQERVTDAFVLECKRIPKTVEPPTTEQEKIKELSKALEEKLCVILKLLDDGESVSTLLQKTVNTFQPHISDVARFFRPKVKISRKTPNGVFYDVEPSEGQRRRLMSLHGAYLTLIFTLLAEYLLRNESTAGGHNQGLRQLQSCLELAVKGFDTNWAKLKFDHRVQGKSEIPRKVVTERLPDHMRGLPDMWCSIAQARALLALAMARAAVVACENESTNNIVKNLMVSNHTAVIGCDVHGPHDSNAFARAKQHLAEARALANWTWWSRGQCSRRTKAAVMTWHDWFWPIFSFIEDGVAYLERIKAIEEWDMLQSPVFGGPVQVKVRWDYQFTDVTVEYQYTILGDEGEQQTVKPQTPFHS